MTCNDSGVNSDYLSIEVEQRPAGISGIYGSVGLDEILILDVSQVETASAFCTYNTGCDGVT